MKDSKEIIKKIKYNNTELEISTGLIAGAADGSVMVKMGDTVVLCTAVYGKNSNSDADFFPLNVQYQEKFHAAGKIPGGFIKREGKSSDREILVSRLIDRPIRPLFDKNFFNETQVICTVHSYDPKYNPDILAIIGASCALAISGAPYLDIVSASRVGMINGKYILNPSIAEIENSDLDLVIAGTKESIMMVESEANLLTNDQMVEALKFGHEQMQPVINLIEELKQEIGKEQFIVEEKFSDKLKKSIKKEVEKDILSAFKIQNKLEKYAKVAEILSAAKEKFVDEENNILEDSVSLAFAEVKSDLLRNEAIKKNIRIDGREFDEVRNISSKIDLFPRTHGSALFTRGETQAMVTSTLGGAQDIQMIDELCYHGDESFMLNYIFPPYSVGEAKPLRAPSRREIGHGKLAYRALKSVIPSKDEFPYTIRVISEITACNGSSSMATVCGASMAMMNASVPLKSPIAGIAMGLIKEQDKVIILSDIMADEDHLGDMDLKVAGNKNKITALQMDIKISGITFDIMKKALLQAEKGRAFILDEMSKTIDKPSKLKDDAPRITKLKIDPSKIRDLIGPGGKIVKELSNKHNASINISDDGLVEISASPMQNFNNAVSEVKSIVYDPEVGDIFDGVVAKIITAGAFITYLGSKDGFIHISEISHKRIGDVSDELSEGQKVKVKVIGFDRGKAKFSIKALVKNDAATGGSGSSNSSNSSSSNNKSGYNRDKKTSSKEDNNDIILSKRNYFE